MTDRVEEVARIIADHTGADPDDGYAEEVAINPRKLAQAIHDAGLIAPAMREEWGEGPLENGEPSHWPAPLDGCVACNAAHPTYRRYVTEWETFDQCRENK